MAEDKKPSWIEKRQAERNRHLLMFLIPVLIIILLVIIVVADRGADKEKLEETGMTTEISPSSTETMPGDSEEPSQGISEETSIAESSSQEFDQPTAESEPQTEAEQFGSLKKDEIPEINQLLQSFYQAVVACDVETVYQIYGRTDRNGIEAERGKMLNNARNLETFENITCYTLEATDENTWMVFVVAETKFRNIATRVPIGTSSFAVRDAEGNFTLVDPENLTPEQAEFKLAADALPEAKRLSLQTNTAYREAIASDPDLQAIYGTLNSGSPLWETGEIIEETVPAVEVLP